MYWKVISNLATSEISIFKLVSLAEETGLSLVLSETPEAGFVALRPICDKYYNHIDWCIYSETCLKRPLKNRKNKGFKAMW